MEQCINGFWQNCSAPKPKPPKLPGVVRDFRDSHPDFESGIISEDPGIVLTTLLSLGEIHPLHFFFAERQTSASTFRIETSISELQICD